MKKLTLSFFALLFCLASYSQTVFTNKSRETCWWNTYSQSFDECSGTSFDNSIFILNENEDMIVHKTSSMTSTYYVTKTENESNFITYEVISDVGNSYTVIFDVEKVLIKIMGSDSEGNIFITMYSVKSVF